MADDSVQESGSGPVILPTGLQLRYDPAWIKTWYLTTSSNKLRELPQFKSQSSSSSTSDSSGRANSNNFEDEVCVDLVYQTLVFCRSSCLTHAQAACFTSIVELILQNLQESDSGGSMQESFTIFSDWIRKHTVAGGPDPMTMTSLSASIKSEDGGNGAAAVDEENLNEDGSPIESKTPKEPTYFGKKGGAYNFSNSEAKLIVEFVSETYFKHFSLYRCCLVKGLFKLDRPLTRVFRLDATYETPTPLFKSFRLKDAENVSEIKRAKDAEEKAKTDSEDAARKTKEAEDAERDRIDKERIMLEQDGYHDPEMQKLLVPPEMRAILEEKIATSETRIREKLTQLDPNAMTEAGQKFMN